MFSFDSAPKFTPLSENSRFARRAMMRAAASPTAGICCISDTKLVREISNRSHSAVATA